MLSELRVRRPCKEAFRLRHERREKAFCRVFVIRLHFLQQRLLQFVQIGLLLFFRENKRVCLKDS